MKTKILEKFISVGIGVGLSLAGLTSGCTSYSREYCEAHGIDYEQQERMRTNPFPALEGLGILLSAGGKTRGQRNAGAAGAEIMGRNLDRQNAIDAAREGKTVVNVGGGGQQETSGEIIDFIIYTRWVDINGDDKVDRKELFGEDIKEFSLSKDNFKAILFNYSSKSGVVTFKSFTERGELVGETKLPYSPYRIVGRYIWPKGIPNPDEKKDFLDKIKENGPGKYRLSATLEDGATFVKDVTFIP